MTMAEYALSFIGRPYIWGGDGSGKSHGGFDCSGLVLECLWAFGRLPKGDLTAQGIHGALLVAGWEDVTPRADMTMAGDVLFFGRDARHITHTAICCQHGMMVEAGGGGSRCRDAKSSTGMVRARPISSRNDLVAVLCGDRVG